MAQPKYSLEELHQILEYAPLTGAFTWKVNRPPRGKAGDPAGALTAGGRLYIYLNGVGYPAGRIAWWMMTGEFPVQEVMFRDQDKTNYCWNNLVLRGKLSEGPLTVQDIKEALSYTPETGELIWINTLGRSRVAEGEVAGSANEARNGRMTLGIKGRRIPRTVAIWVLQTGAFPPAGMLIDHKDRDPSNERWSNLRLATPQQNAGNRNDKPPQKHGLPRGVYKITSENYGYRIMFEGKRNGQSGYGSPEAAHEAYQQAHQKLHKAYSNYTS